MKITTVLFDLDGTLLPMDQEKFIKSYFGGISARLARHGYAPQTLIKTIWAGTEDMVAQTLGMRVFLLTDCLINKNNTDISAFPNGNFDGLATFLKELNEE